MGKTEIELAERANLMLAYLCVKDMEGFSAKLEILDKFGLEDEQIASLCSVAVKTVRNVRAQQRQASGSTTKKGGK